MNIDTKIQNAIQGEAVEILLSKKEILTPNEVQAEYSFSTSTLAKWRMKRKNLEFFRIGNFIRYKRSDIEAFINKNMIEVTL